MKTAQLLISTILFCFSAAAEEAAELVWIDVPGGCFQMGETRVYREEGPVQEACTEPLQMTATEITNAQFAAFVEATGYVTRAERGWRADEPDGPGLDVPPGSAVFSPPSGDRGRGDIWWQLVEGANWRVPLGPENSTELIADAPVVHVTLEDAAAFADWAGGRLPTEAEWERAARGGHDGKLLTWEDNEEADATPMANTWQGIFPIHDLAADGFAGVAPVASFPPNDFGLYDMIGNVWELSATPYAPSYSDADRARSQPAGYDPSQPGIPVVAIRGGSYLCATSYCYRFRPAARQAQDIAFGTSHVGFRIVRAGLNSSSEEPSP